MRKFLLLVGLLVFSLPLTVGAATLYFAPSSGSHGVGGTFSVNVLVSSPEQAMNAVSGIVSFPTDKFTVVSLNQVGSIIKFWVEEPSFSNSVGTVRFEGIVPNPGFQGVSGKVLTITFRTKAAGASSLAFVTSSILANDGYGTNILTGVGQAQFKIGVIGPIPDEAGEAELFPTPSGVPESPRIISPTHPDKNKWYASNEPRFEWSLPAGVNAVRLIAGRNSGSSPTVLYDPPISFREMEGLADGIWYFRGQLRNKNGWSNITTYRFNIDIELPSSFSVDIAQRTDQTIPRLTLAVSAEDETSGIDHYEILAGGEVIAQWTSEEGQVYETSDFKPGEYSLTIRAIDKAGNFLEESLEFFVEALDPPILTKYPLRMDEPLVFKGTTYPGAEVVVWLQEGDNEPLSFKVNSNEEGNFKLSIGQRLRNGVYSLSAEVALSNGARSNLSDPITIDRAPSIFSGFKSFGMFVLKVLPWIIIVALLALFGWHIYTQHTSRRERIRREVRSTERHAKKSLAELQNEILEEMKRLEKIKSKEELPRAQRKILARLEKEFSRTEKMVRKEIRDIEKFLD